MHNELCQFSRCKNSCYLSYIGISICHTHWIQICEAEGKTEKRILKRIGLMRDKKGAIVTIKDEND